jgi:hypothetical protein
MARIRVARKVGYIKEASLARTQSTQLQLFNLPSGAIPVSVTCFTAAAAVGATLDVGTLADDDIYVQALDVSGAGTSAATVLNITKLTEPTGIYALIGGAPAAGGPFTVFFEYISDKSTGPK